MKSRFSLVLVLSVFCVQTIAKEEMKHGLDVMIYGNPKGAYIITDSPEAFNSARTENGTLVPVIKGTFPDTPIAGPKPAAVENPVPYDNMDYWEQPADKKSFFNLK